MIFQFGPSTPNYSNLGHCIPIWSLFRIPVFQLGSFWGRIFQFGPFSSTYIPMCPPVMELFQYGPHRCRLSVVAGVLGGTHCESVWSRFWYGHATSVLRTILEPYSCTVHVLDLLLEYNSMALRCYATSTIDRYDRYPYMYLGTTEVRYSVDT